MQQLILGIGNAIQLVMEPYCQNARGSQGKLRKLSPLRAFGEKTLPMHKNHDQDRIWGQFHQHFWCQCRAALAQSSFDAFDGNNVWQQCTKIWCSVQKLQPKICNNILIRNFGETEQHLLSHLLISWYLCALYKSVGKIDCVWNDLI